MISKEILFRDLKEMPYQEAWDFQEQIFKEIVQIKIVNRRNETQLITPNYFFFVTHPHVYTLGKSGDIKHLLASENELKQRGATFVKTNRGGDITYHGPGQIVGYPILDLENFFTDIHKYLRFLEEVIIHTLADFGIIATRSPGETGVWLDVDTPFARKICAMGVRASRWVTMHGFALNVNTDLSYFNAIIPCGIKNKAVSSMQAELNAAVDESKVKQRILNHFESIFEARLVASQNEQIKNPN